MAASVWIMLWSVSVAFVSSSPAVTVRPSAETIPWVTVGVPAASPSALPMATTPSPTCSRRELPNVTSGRSETPSICRSATSSVALVPRSVAGRTALVPVRVTVMTPPFSAPAMTWLLVTTRPPGVMIIPVPWSSL